MLSTDSVKVIALPNPFTRELLEAEAPVGASIRDIAGPLAGEQVFAFLNGTKVKYSDWETTLVKAEDFVNLIHVPAGSGSDLIRLVGLVAVAWFAWWAAPWVVGHGVGAAGWTAAGAAGTTGFFASAGFWQGAIFAAGAYALNALIPPPAIGGMGGDQPTRLQSLTGTRNAYAPFGQVPSLYGTHRLYPPFAAMPYTEIIGNDQYFNAIYCIGLGEYDVSAADVKIGDTLAQEYEGADISITDQPNFPAVVEEQLSITLAQNAEPPADGENAVRTSATDSEALSIDIQFPAGLLHTQPDGDRSSAVVEFRIEYAVAGSGSWVNVRTTDWQTATQGSQSVVGTPNWNALANSINGLWSSPDDATLFRVTAKSNDGKRVGLKWSVPSGQYDVRLTRVQTFRLGSGSGAGVPSWDGASRWERFSAISIWSALRSYRGASAVVLPANTMTFIRARIKATEQLTGLVDSLNVVATRKLPIYDGNNWSAPTAAASGIPAWAFADILRGSGNARPLDDSRIDLDALQSWATETAAAGRQYHEVLDYSTSVFEALRRVASVGRASTSIRDGKWSVLQELQSPTPVQYFTPRNSWGFKGTKQFFQMPHALKVRFVSALADYQDDEIIVYDDGYTSANATRFETLEIKGITDADYAWKTGRYHLAALRLRPEVYTWSADVEHIVCQRGDHVRVAHDIPLWGSGQGRIKALAGDIITTDERMTLEAGTYHMRLRNSSGQGVLLQVTTTGGLEVDTFTRTGTLSGAYGTVQAGDLFMVGQVGAETKELVVIGIRPGADLTAHITAVDAAPEILDADTGTIPPYDPGITLPTDPRLVFPPKPYNVQVFSGDNIQLRVQDGSSTPRMLITWDYASEAINAFPGTTITVRYREYVNEGGTLVYGEYKYAYGIPATDGFYAVTDVEIGTRYEITLMAVSRHDAPSGYTVAIIHLVDGATFAVTVPPTPVTVSASGRVRVIVNFPFDWDENADVAHVEFGKSDTNDHTGITEVVRVAVPPKLADLSVMGVFLQDVGLTRYFFARIQTLSNKYSAWTTGVAGTAFGLTARYMVLISEGQIFSYDNSSGTPALIGPSAIDFNVLRNGVSGPVTWEAWDSQGVPITPVSNILTISGENNINAVMPASLFGAIANNDHITVRASSEDIYDEVSVVRLLSGRDGSAGDAISGILSNETHGVPTDVDGANWNMGGANGEFRVWLGLGEITTGNGVVYNVAGGANSGADHVLTKNGLRVAIDRSTGLYVVTVPTSWTTDAEAFELRALYDGNTVPKVLTVFKVRGGADGPPGIGAIEGYCNVDGPATWIRDKDGSTWEPAATTTDLDWTFELDGAAVARISRRITRDASGILVASVTTHPSNDLNTARVSMSVVGDGTRALTYVATYSFDGHVKAVAQGISAALSGEDGADGANGVNLFLLDTAGIVSSSTGTFSAGNGVTFGSQLSTYKRSVTLDEVGLAPGDIISASARVAHTDAAHTVLVRILFYDGVGASTGIFSGAAATATSLTRMVAENATIPANTAYMQLFARVSGGTGTVTIDRGMINRGPLAAQYSPPSRGGISEVSVEDFVSGIEPVLIHVGSQPAGSHLGVDLVLWTTDGQLYRWNGSAYTVAIPAVNISGQITGTQITDQAISAPKMAANSITAANGAIANLAVTDAKINTMSATKLTAGTISAAIVLAQQLVLSTLGKLYSGSKSTVDSSVAGVFLGHISGSNYGLAVGDGNKFLRFRQDTGVLETSKVRIGGSTQGGPMPIDVGSGRTAPLVAVGVSMDGATSGTHTEQNRFTGVIFRSPTYGSGFNPMRVIANRMDFIIEAHCMAASTWETLQFRYQYDSEAEVIFHSHRFDGNGRQTFPALIRFTSRSTSWGSLLIRATTSEGRTVMLSCKITCYNIAESTNSSNSHSGTTGGGTGTWSPTTPPEWNLP